MFFFSYWISIDSIEDKSTTYCGVDLENNYFSHGQLYVAFSRVGRPDHLYVYAPQNKTQNVVYQEVLTQTILELSNYVSFVNIHKKSYI